MTRSAFLVLIAAAAAAWPLKAEYDAKRAAGPFAVVVDRGEWIDSTRDGRDVPWKLYLPAGAERPLPIVVWSHGLGGSREGAEFLGRHLASHGYAAFYIQHHGSDTEVLREGVQNALRNATGNAQAAVNRFRDVKFAVDQIERIAEEGKYKGRFDTKRMGISGHSYGAITTLVAAGQTGGRFGHVLAEPRFRAAFPMSPSPPRNGTPEEAFADMLMPIFHVTLTDDGDPIGQPSPEDRLTPFRTIDNVDQYLLLLTDAVHMTFSGRDAKYDKMERHHELVKIAAAAFWDAYLREDAAARLWLDQGGFAAELGSGGTFEVKPASR